jgi:BTB/POZ domain-containing protein KCTD9
MNERLSYEDSFRFLQSEGWEGPGDIPPLPDRPPRYDDETLGLSFFRTFVKDAKLEYLTIPRTYFGRSQIDNVSLAGSDLHESVANWNDLNQVDFSMADLRAFDFRGCVLRRIRFDGALLNGADLRCCSIEDCSFVDADMTGAHITRDTGASLCLSAQQREQIIWHDEDGPEPDGG